MTLIQSLNFVNLVFNSLIYSLVIRIAIPVNRAVLDEITVPAPGLSKPIVDEPTAEADPTSISVKINNTSFYLNSYTFFIIFIINFK